MDYGDIFGDLNLADIEVSDEDFHTVSELMRGDAFDVAKENEASRLELFRLSTIGALHGLQVCEDWLVGYFTTP